MISPMVLALPIVAAGIGTAAGYSATHSDKNKRIHFVERESIDSELKHLDVEVDQSDTCVVCGDGVGPDNLGAIIREDDEYQLVCDKATCLDTYDIE